MFLLLLLALRENARVLRLNVPCEVASGLCLVVAVWIGVAVVPHHAYVVDEREVRFEVTLPRERRAAFVAHKRRRRRGVLDLNVPREATLLRVC